MAQPDLLSPFIAKAAGRKLVLHIDYGEPSGFWLNDRYQTPDYLPVRVAASAQPAPDIRGDIRHIPAPDASVDAIWAQHVFEQLTPEDVMRALTECRRLLKPEGEFGCVIPDMQALALHIVNGRLEMPLYQNAQGEPVYTFELLYGKHMGVQQRAAFTAETLAHKLSVAGFSNITVLRKELELWVGAFNYPSGHPKRVEKSRILQDKTSGSPPAAPPLSQQPHPGLMHKGKLPDELDVPPKMWEY